MRLNSIILEDKAGTRLDTMVCGICRTCSRKHSAILILSGQIMVNNTRKKPGYRVKPGDLVKGSIPDFQNEPAVLPERIALSILYEDDHIVVLDKQPGMVVHPAPGNETGTLVNALLSRYPEIKKAGKDLFRAGIVHRLDKDTSGVMVVARTDDSLFFLQKEFKQRRVKKKYLALVFGSLSSDEGEITLPISRHSTKRKLMAVNLNDGKPAMTCWKIKQRFKAGFSLVDVLLKTGRTHQIRVHFYAVDHPLVGDPVYQYRRFRKNPGITAPRQMLHSHELSFRHPYSGERMSFTAGLPDDFSQTLSRLDA